MDTHAYLEDQLVEQSTIKLIAMPIWQMVLPLIAVGCLLGYWLIKMPR